MSRMSNTPIYVLAILALFSWSACDPESSNPTETTEDTTPTIDPEQSTGGGAIAPTSDVIPDDTESIPMPDYEGHGLGEEDPSLLIPVGTLSGTWRVGINDVNNAPVMHIDFVHDQGATTATCDFIMYEGLETNFAEKIGKCKDASFDGSKLTFKFNPTEQWDYNMTLTTTTMENEDTFKGTISAPNGDTVDTWDVVITRRKFDANDDGVRPPSE